MKTSLLFSIYLFFSVAALHAQFKVVGESQVFEEPEKGSVKLMQLKNGSTALLSLNDKHLVVQLYNSSYKKKSEQNLELDFTKHYFTKAIFELNSDIVLFIQDYESRRTPILYRLIIDGSSGTLKKNEKIADLSKISYGQGLGIAFADVPMPSFFIRKDADGDGYAIALMNSFESDRNKRVEIALYDKENKEVSRAYYTSPEDKYKYLELMDMVVTSTKRVSAIAYAYNTKSSGGNEKVLVWADLPWLDNVVKVTELPFAKNLYISDVIMKYNPVTKQMIAVAATTEKKGSNKYTCYLAGIDPQTKHTTYSGVIYPSKANEKKMELFGSKNRFTGPPQSLYINNDGTFSIVYEEMLEIIGKYSVSTELGNIAVSKYNANGKELSSCFIPKSQLLHHSSTSPYYIAGRELPYSTIVPFYLYDRERNFTILDKGNQFKSFAYLNGGEKTYILFNDIEENAERVKKGKITTIQGVGECNGYYYNISGYKGLPDRDFVFGNPAKKQNNLALFAVSDYDKLTNTYVTLKLEKDGKDKGVKLVWLQPQ